jgi:hypothetical protein
MSSRFVEISSRSQVRETIEEISEPCKTGMIDRTALGRVADPAYEYSTAKNTACSDPQLSGSQNPCQSDRKSSSLVRYRCLNQYDSANPGFPLFSPTVTNRNLLSLNCSSVQMAPCSKGDTLPLPAYVHVSEILCAL